MHYLDNFDIQSIHIDGSIYTSAHRADLFCDSRVNVFLQAVKAAQSFSGFDDASIDVAAFAAQLSELESKKVLFVVTGPRDKYLWRLVGRD